VPDTLVWKGCILGLPQGRGDHHGAVESRDWLPVGPPVVVRLMAEAAERMERIPFILKEQPVASAQGHGDDRAVVAEALAPKAGGQSAQVDGIAVKGGLSGLSGRGGLLRGDALSMVRHN
jgi:hypothetical protein